MSEDEKNKIDLTDRFSNLRGAKLKPIVLEFKKTRNSKEDDNDEDDDEQSSDNRDNDDAVDEGGAKYSRGLEDIQRLEGNVVRVTQKATKALSKGVDVYERERERSAKEKTDGAIEDFIHNSAKASSAAIKEAADIPIDLAEAINPVASRKRLRKNLRRVSKFIRLWRI